jgi:acetyl esterase/lipase
VIPAPTLISLAFAVIIPEVGLVALPVCLVFGALSLWLARGRTRVAVSVLTMFTVCCVGWPLVAYPPTAAAADRALDAAGDVRAAVNAYAVDVTRDVPVRLRDGSALALDVYRPRVAGTRPLLVTIYGGAWIFGTRVNEAPLARRYAAQGYVVAVIDYRHAPKYRFPTQIDDVDDALKTIASHAREWHADPHRAALLGRSAGAQLALLAAEKPQPLTIRAVIGYYAPADLIGGWNEPPRPDPANTKRILTAYLGGAPDGERRALYVRAAPLQQAHAGMPSTLLIGGDRDELVPIRIQREFSAHLRALGVPVVSIELPWANHAFDEANGIGALIAADATARFLAYELTTRATTAAPGARHRAVAHRRRVALRSRVHSATERH